MNLPGHNTLKLMFVGQFDAMLTNKIKYSDNADRVTYRKNEM